MPRRLSDPEWVAFQNNVNLNALALPPWGAVVLWGSQYILVFVCQGSGSVCQKGEVMLSDVSDRQDLIKDIPSTYDANQEVWVYHVVPETMARLYEVAQSSLETTGKILQGVGEAAGALTAPILENLTIPLVALGIVLLFIMSPRR